MASALRKVALALASRSEARLMSGSAATSGKHAAAHAKMWERICYFGVYPVLIVSSYLIWQQEQGHHEEPPEFVEYEHMRIRRKNFPWGDGKRSFFHNPETNPLPGIGYEVTPKH